MRKLLAAVAMMLACPAWSQTSWSTDQFSVTSDKSIGAVIVNGSLEILFPDLPYSYSNSGAGENSPPSQFDLDFAPQPGYVLAGEQVTFTVDMAVDTYDAPTDMVEKAYGRFTADINGRYSLDHASDGGTFHDAGAYFLSSSTLLATASATTFEGVACPLGHDANDCNFGLDVVFLDSMVEFTSFDVTPILVVVPEPDMQACWLAGMGLYAIVAMTRRRIRRPHPVR